MMVQQDKQEVVAPLDFQADTVEVQVGVAQTVYPAGLVAMPQEQLMPLKQATSFLTFGEHQTNFVRLERVT